jgi:hypothetical protein
MLFSIVDKSTHNTQKVKTALSHRLDLNSLIVEAPLSHRVDPLQLTREEYF